MSRPSKRIDPAVGSSSLMSVRPSVVLPQPDSPTRPSVSPCSTRQVDAVDRAHRPDRALEDSRRLIGKCLTSPCDAKQLVAVRRRVRRGALKPLAVSPPSSLLAPLRPHRRRRALRPAPRRSGSADTWSTSPIGRSTGTSVRHTQPAAARRAARVERAAGRRRDQLGGWPGIGSQPLLIGVEPRQAVQQADRVRVARLVEDREDVGQLDDPAARTSRRPGRRARRPRRGRA